MPIDISDGQQDATKMKAKVHEPPSILHKAVLQTCTVPSPWSGGPRGTHY